MLPFEDRAGDIFLKKMPLGIEVSATSRIEPL
jgi:hypothetical protein